MAAVKSSLGANLSRPNPRGQLIDGLRRQLGRWEATGTAEDAAVFSCGAAAVDRLLPGGGLRHGMLVEWVAKSNSEGESPNSNAPPPQPSPGGRGGAATLGLLGAREACREGGALVVIDRRQTLYPPAVAAWGIDLDRVIVVHPQNARDELWAAVQALRSPAVAAMFTVIDRLDSRAFRRLQLAAQGGRTLGVLVRPAGARGEPSWADVTLESGGQGVRGREDERWQRTKVSHLSSLRPVQVCVLRCHSGRAGGSVMLEIDDATYTVREASSTYDTHPLPVVAELGDSAGYSLSARA